MSALERMLDILRPMHLYSLDAQSFVHRELQCYAYAFDPLLERVRLLGEDMFVQTCSGRQLANWERILGLPVARTEEDYRREMILSRLALCERDNTCDGIGRALISAGLSASVQERPPNGALRIYDAVIIGGYQTLDEVKKQVRSVLPAHLGAEFDIGTLTWEDFDARGRDFIHLDALDFTWEWFDLNGDKI